MLQRRIEQSAATAATAAAAAPPCHCCIGAAAAAAAGRQRRQQRRRQKRAAPIAAASSDEQQQQQQQQQAGEQQQHASPLPPPPPQTPPQTPQQPSIIWPPPPWDVWELISVVGVVVAVDQTIPALVVTAAARAQGVGVAELGFDERQLLNLACQLLQLAATAGALRCATSRHAPQPAPWWRVEPSFEAVVQGASGAVAAVGLGLLLAAFVDQHSDGAAEWRSLAALHDHHQASAAGLPPPPSPLSPGFAALVLGAVLLAPATEELLFRGYLLPSLAGLGLPLPAAVALDAAAFAAVHPAEGGAAGYAAEALLGALLAGAAVAGGGNLAVPLVAHAGYNAIVLLLGSSVSAAAS